MNQFREGDSKSSPSRPSTLWRMVLESFTFDLTGDTHSTYWPKRKDWKSLKNLTNYLNSKSGTLHFLKPYMKKKEDLKSYKSRIILTERQKKKLFLSSF